MTSPLHTMLDMALRESTPDFEAFNAARAAGRRAITEAGSLERYLASGKAREPVTDWSSQYEEAYLRANRMEEIVEKQEKELTVLRKRANGIRKAQADLAEARAEIERLKAPPPPPVPKSLSEAIVHAWRRLETAGGWARFAEITGDVADSSTHDALAALAAYGWIEVYEDVPPRRYRITPGLPADVQARLAKAMEVIPPAQPAP